MNQPQSSACLATERCHKGACSRRSYSTHRQQWYAGGVARPHFFAVGPSLGGALPGLLSSRARFFPSLLAPFSICALSRACCFSCFVISLTAFLAPPLLACMRMSCGLALVLHTPLLHKRQPSWCKLVHSWPCAVCLELIQPANTCEMRVA